MKFKESYRNIEAYFNDLRKEENFNKAVHYYLFMIYPSKYYYWNSAFKVTLFLTP